MNEESVKLEMLNAVLQDNRNNQNKLPATNKLDKLDLFIKHLLNKDSQERLLNDNILEVVRKWLEPLPDFSLPNIKIKKGILEALRNIYINKDLVLDSKIGVILHFYMINPKENKEIRNMAKEIVYNWLNKIMKEDEY
ncbi:transcription factor IWS1 [Vairimorpha necatrix]|uniref:Transcription factor IWS1 n=1 Tax=Vairimorpha necatrix TaxID=6039 RepID=A0AAX4JAW4_9MICR